MSLRPTGSWTPTPTGGDLVVTRTFRAPIEDVWASITEPVAHAAPMAVMSASPAMASRLALMTPPWRRLWL